MQRSWLEICKQSFLYNVHSIKKIVGDAQLGIVVKANAYGHGLEQIAHLVQENPYIDWLFTATAQEALFLRKIGISKPLLIVGIYDASYEEIIAHNIHIAVYEIGQLTEIHKSAQNIQKKAFIHLKIDTGLSRLGIVAEDIEGLMPSLVPMSGCSVVGLFTHLADTHNSDTTFTKKQLDIFNRVIKKCEHILGKIPYTHALASGSLWLHKEYPYSVVRVGTCLYGFWKSELNKQRLQVMMPTLQLLSIMTWKSRISALYRINHHQYAIIPVGFSDGYPCSLVGKAQVLIHGNFEYIVEIKAHEMVVKIIYSSSVKKGDEVIIMDNFVGIQAHDLAQLYGGLSHEFTARISPCVARLIK
jgi:alanine racemase